VGESWQTYTWQGLHKTEVECLNGSPNDSYLYIVKFKDTASDEIVGFYIIPGLELLDGKQISSPDLRVMHYGRSVKEPCQSTAK